MQDVILTPEEMKLARKLLPSALIAAAILVSVKTGKLIREPEAIAVELALRLSRDTARVGRSAPEPDTPATLPESPETSV